MSTEDNKQLVRRLVREAVGERNLYVLGQVAAGEFARVADRWVIVPTRYHQNHDLPLVTFAATKLAISRSRYLRAARRLRPLRSRAQIAVSPSSTSPRSPSATRFITNADLLQQTVRGAVRRAIEDPSFAALFAFDAMILGQWPLTSR